MADEVVAGAVATTIVGGAAEETPAVTPANEVIVGNTADPAKGEEKPEDKGEEKPEDKGDEEGKTSDKSKDGKADKGDEGAPETYEGYVMPEGVEIDAPMVEKFNTVAKELDLNQANAQKLVDMYAQVKADETAAWAETQTEWRQAAKDHADYGGAKYDASVAKASLALDTFGSKELGETLVTTGFGNNPDLIALLVKVGNEISEATVELGGGKLRKSGKTPGQIMYPSMNSKS